MEFDVLAPLDAIRVGDWEDCDGHVQRYFHGTRRGTQVPVQIAGIQDVGGSVIARIILIGREQIEMDVAEVQELMWTLAEANTEVERLNSYSDRDVDGRLADVLPDIE